jgi:hypothetical protein
VKLIVEIGGAKAVYRILSNGLRTCKERLNARSGSIYSLLSSRDRAAVTVLWKDKEAGHDRSKEGAEFPRGNIFVSITPVGQPHRMLWNRIVHVDNSQP